MKRIWVALVVVLVLVVSAGCLGGGGGDPTTTDAPTVTTTDTPTTTTPEPTPTPTPTATTAEPEPTTTHTPTPDIQTTGYRVGFGPVYDGTAEFVMVFENTGASGSVAYNITLVRHEGGDFDRTATGEVFVGANARVNRTVTVDFRATGTYSVIVNGQREATIDVRGLRVSGGNGDSTTSEPAPPAIDVSVSGSSVVG